jgi:hypothetical protein
MNIRAFGQKYFNFHSAHSAEYFFNLMDWILINPVVSSGLKLSNESIDASSSEYSFSVLLERPRTYVAPL